MVSVKGWNVKVYKDGSQLGKCATASVDFDTNIDSFFSLGYRTPQQEEGSIGISGSLERLWIDNTLTNLLGTEQSGLTVFDLSFEVGSGPKMYLYDCKLEKLTVDFDAEGYSRTPLDFRAESYAFVD